MNIFTEKEKSEMNINPLQNENLTFAKPTFYKIPAQKQQRIIDIAKTEFAQNGFNAANINIIAKKADISIGSLYNYFDSKDDLFLTVACNGLHEMINVISLGMRFSGNVSVDVKNLIKLVIEFIIKEKELSMIYNEVAYAKTSANLQVAQKYAKDNLFFIYKQIVQSGIDDKLIRNDVDIDTIIFVLDAIFSAIRLAFTNDDPNSLCDFASEKLKSDIDFFAENIAKILQSSFEIKNDDK